VLQQLLRAAARSAGARVTTSTGGLFLLTRGLLDIRLDALAREFQVPFEPLKGALASWWFDRMPPFDAGAAVWIGREQPAIAELDEAPLATLQDALFDRLLNHRALDALPDVDQLVPDAPRLRSTLGCSADTCHTIASIGWMALRAWSRWLPGIAASSREFLARNCLERAASVDASSTEIAVHLAPAPLDIVIEMAGYFKPIDRVAWLDNRTVSFVVRRSARM